MTTNAPAELADQAAAKLGDVIAAAERMPDPDCLHRALLLYCQAGAYVEALRRRPDLAADALPLDARALGDPETALSNVSRQSQGLEVKLGAEGFAKVGLPPYHKITLRRKPCPGDSPPREVLQSGAVFALALFRARIVTWSSGAVTVTAIDSAAPSERCIDAAVGRWVSPWPTAPHSAVAVEA